MSPTEPEGVADPTAAGAAPAARPLAEAIGALLDEAGVTHQRKLVAQMVESSLGLGLDTTTRLDLKISAAALAEMREAFRLFAPFAGIPKVSVFGSARTHAHDPLFAQAEAVARGLSQRGWLVVTGAGPGIMEAATTGAGAERSLGVSIRLPFEEKPSSELAAGGRQVSMKYFFTRKLMLVKESHGFICLPGGFGTLDEMFELLTLQQTGKAVPVPIVLLDRPGGEFWRGLERYVLDHLQGSGMISPGDFDRVLVTDSVEEAVAEISGFWRNYDSLRWVGEQLVFRLRSAPTDAELDALNERFGHLLVEGVFARSEPLPPEVTDGDRLVLPRIVFTPQQRSVGELYRIIRVVNGWGPVGGASAPAVR